VALIPEDHRADAAAFLADVSHTGAPGTVHVLPRPGQRLSKLIFFGVGSGDEHGWRTGGAAVARNAAKHASVALVLPTGASPDTVRGFAEGAALAAYRYRLGADNPDKAPKLRRVRIVTGDADTGLFEEALATARAVVSATAFARDLTNAPSAQKTPAWFAKQVDKAARGDARLTIAVREPNALAAEGFGGILAVGRGSAHPPRLVELSWRPRRAQRHVVLVGKGITFDTGGICIKPRDGMKLMRKDMGGAAAVVAATVGAAALNLPVRITALAPLAENLVGADSYRPGDVVRHYGGITSEITNTDAEGRLVLADALAYAVRRLRPDVIVDLATLTGAQSIALGKRTAALFSPNDDLAGALADAAALAGEKVWRMPLGEDYVEALDSDVADLVNSTDIGAGSMLAALYLREFTGAARDRWAHLDMSAPAWADSADGELVKGATGWGVRTLLRWLQTEAQAGS
jgi:leucyl aminopeptidase